MAAKALATYYELEKVTLSVTLAELGRQRSGFVNREPVETLAGFMEPAIRIERTTCGLRIRFRGLLKSLMTWAIPHPSTVFRLFGVPWGYFSLSHSTGFCLYF